MKVQLFDERLLWRNAEIKFKHAYEQKKYTQLCRTWCSTEKGGHREVLTCVVLLYSLAIIDLLQLSSGFSWRHRCVGVEIHCWRRAGLWGGRFSKLGRARASVRMKLMLLSSSSKHWSSTALHSLTFSTELMHIFLPGQSQQQLSSSLCNYCMSGAQSELRGRRMKSIQADLRQWRKDASVALI